MERISFEARESILPLEPDGGWRSGDTSSERSRGWGLRPAYQLKLNSYDLGVISSLRTRSIGFGSSIPKSKELF
jgi:hypothetical protein